MSALARIAIAALRNHLEMVEANLADPKMPGWLFRTEAGSAESIAYLLRVAMIQEASDREGHGL